MVQRISTLALVLAAVLATGAKLEAADAELVQLQGVGDLQLAFDRDGDVPRLVLLLSPT